MPTTSIKAWSEGHGKAEVTRLRKEVKELNEYLGEVELENARLRKELAKAQDDVKEQADFRESWKKARRELKEANERIKELLGCNRQRELDNKYLVRAIKNSTIVLDKLGPVPAQLCVTHNKKLPLTSFRLRATKRGRWAIGDGNTANGNLVSFRPQCWECEGVRNLHCEDASIIPLQQSVSLWVDRSPKYAAEFFESFMTAYVHERERKALSADYLHDDDDEQELKVLTG